jgi:small nuclear ribonucleoprotein (snRNP)-like protein
MSSGLAFWGPFLVIFGAALVISVIQRYARDICLMKFDGCHVLIQMKNGRWVWGTLEVHSKALEIIYSQAERTATGGEMLTEIFYEQNVAEILIVLRPEPAPGSPAHEHWLREMKRLRNPPFFARLMRDLRNLFNMLRNAFGESIAVVVGIVKQRTAVGKIVGADQKATEAGKQLLMAIPASYEPILEHYLSREVAVESFKDMANLAAGVTERVGVLAEYSDKFILLRDVLLSEWLPAEALRDSDARDRFAVLLPRANSFVRHLARRSAA